MDLNAIAMGGTRPIGRPTVFDWNQTLEPRFVGIDEGTILYAMTGEGPPLLLLHGFGGEIWMWERQVPALSKRHCLYIPDLIGYGYSDRPKVDYTPSLFIDSIRQFMDQLGVRSASLIGNSMGAGIAWAFALTHPERVDKLILIDGIPPQVVHAVRNRFLRCLLAIRHVPLLPYLAIALQTRRTVRMALMQVVSNGRLITDVVVERQYRISRLAGTARVMASTIRYADEVARYADALATLRKPTLIIWGERDELFPVEVGQQLHASIRDSRLVVIKDSGTYQCGRHPTRPTGRFWSFLGAIPHVLV
ncbi:Carboxylesterase [Candidatus Methylomirabilis lanthanidiphila]|uniref:Carboxylesterase n=1 Tax=Candidatus Methylomirabilis lanthanidiphila TaxID=2211376 RepID=A0A564ZJP5_9BACT|nr:Carboxylesterase [Candidatus Methylomirabilis lanthanidiphila]